jgi:hypothetical protein
MMDCRTCQPTLLDLANGELAPELAESAREHLRGCAGCSADLAKLRAGVALSRQLPWVEPPADLTARILANAQQHAQAKAQRSATRERAQVGFVQGVLDFVARVASARQVAMATVMLLIVAVGLWQLPELQRRPEAAGVTVVSPDPAGEAAPTHGLSPAEPLDLTVDARARRIRGGSREEDVAPGAAMPAAPPAEAAYAKGEGAAAAEAESFDVTATKGAEKDELRLDDVDSVFAAEPKAREARAENAGDAFGEAEAAKVDALQRQASAFPANEGVVAQRRTYAAPKRKAAAPAAAAPELAQARAESAEPASSIGSGAARAPADLAAMPAPKVSAPEAGSATELLAAARARRKQLGCAAALDSYEAVVRNAPDTSQAGAAMLELAECNFALGRDAVARSWAERATKNAAVASRAQQLLREHAGADKAAAAEASPEP